MLRPFALMFVSLVVAGFALAQGGLRWPDPQAQPELFVRQVGEWDYVLCFTGWASVGPQGPTMSGGAAGAVGVPPAVRSVSSAGAGFVDDGTGSQAQAVLFPFVPDARVLPIFAPTEPTYDWYGVLAPVTLPVPQRVPGTLCFKVQRSPIAVSFPTLLGLMQQARAGVAETDANGNLTGSSYIVTASSVSAATVLDYRFDRGGGAFAINHAGSTGGAPVRGSLAAGPGGPWVDGRFGGALRGATAFCDTGWNGGLYGSFAIAWFCKQRAAISGRSDFCGADNFACYTGGDAGLGVRCVGWGGAPLHLTTDVRTRAATEWVHVALVVDADAGTATWYVDGVVRQTDPISSAADLVTTVDGFRIGMHPANPMPGRYDIDDFRLRSGPATTTEIAVWASSSPASAVSFDRACGAALRDSGGEPSLGNAGYGLRIEGPPNANVGLTFGLGTTLGAVDLPFDLGLVLPQLAGCAWHSNFFVTLSTTTNANGRRLVAFPIRNDPAWANLEVYVQALMLDASLVPFATNPLVLSID